MPALSFFLHVIVPASVGGNSLNVFLIETLLEHCRVREGALFPSSKYSLRKLHEAALPRSTAVCVVDVHVACLISPMNLQPHVVAVLSFILLNALKIRFNKVGGVRACATRSPAPFYHL